MLRRLHQDGWYEVRRRGSHRVMRHATKRGIVVVAGNPGAEMKAGTLGQVLKQARLKENHTENVDGTD
jgi:predicted RNA binding protein YcfA (HicA-like mRNA interferase family)